MTKTEVEVITSAEPRRRWSAEEKRRIVAAAIEPGAVVSEVARGAGIPVSQLFHWRKQLCGPAREKARVCGGDGCAVCGLVEHDRGRVCQRGAAADHGRDRQGDRVGDDQGVGQGHRAPMHSHPDRGAGVAGDGAHRHAEGLCEPVAAGAGSIAPRPAEWPLVLLPWAAAEGREMAPAIAELRPCRLGLSVPRISIIAPTVVHSEVRSWKTS